MKEAPTKEMRLANNIRDLLYPGLRSCLMQYDGIEARLICREPGDIFLEMISGQHMAEIRLANAFNDDSRTLFLPKMKIAFEVFHQVTQA